MWAHSGWGRLWPEPSAARLFAADRDHLRGEQVASPGWQGLQQARYGGATKPAERHGCPGSPRLPCLPFRIGKPEPLSDPNTDAKTVLSVLAPPCSGRLSRILSNLERKPGFVHQDAGRHVLARCHAVREKTDLAVLVPDVTIRERKDVSRHVQTRCPQRGQASIGPRCACWLPRGAGTTIRFAARPPVDVGG